MTTTNPESGMKQFFYDTAPSTPGVACSSTALPSGAGLNVSPLGHLVKTYDANGTTTCFSYDAVNRNTGIAYFGTNFDGNNKYFVYDSATVDGAVMTNVLGRLAEAYTAPTSTGTKVTDEGFSYTPRGEISDVYQWSTNSNGWYHTTATYFANHALNTLSGIPGQSTWTYSLDGKGRPYSAIQGASTNMVSSVTYNAADEPCVVTLGLGDADTYNYDGNATCPGLLTTGRMTSYTFSIGATPTTDVGTLTWNSNGTLRGLAVVDGINSTGTQTCAYGTPTSAGYDEFGRLISVNCTNSVGTTIWNQAFSYDLYDNITKTGSITWACSTCYNAANNQYNSTLGSVSYDSNGNLLTDTFHTYTWNQDNKLKAITDASTSMTYDAYGRMIEKKTGSAYNQELISPIGEVAYMQKQTVSEFRMPLPGGDTAESGVQFQHRDWLGSVRLESTRGTRMSFLDRAFAPYGENYNNIGSTTDVNFTGDNQDLVAGTFDTPNRELNPIQGRWISPDPSQSGWNAYSYTTNPLADIDPSGLQARTVMSGCYSSSGQCWYTSFQIIDVSNNGTPVCQSLGGCSILTNPGAYGISYVPNPYFNPGLNQTSPDIGPNNPIGTFIKPLPPDGWLSGYVLLNSPVNNMPTVSQWRPPNSTDTVRSPQKVLPYKPTFEECFSNPGNAVELMNGTNSQGDPQESNPVATALAYQSTSRGNNSVTSGSGNAIANFIVLGLNSLGKFGGCLLGSLFGG